MCSRMLYLTASNIPAGSAAAGGRQPFGDDAPASGRGVGWNLVVLGRAAKRSAGADESAGSDEDAARSRSSSM